MCLINVRLKKVIRCDPRHGLIDLTTHLGEKNYDNGYAKGTIEPLIKNFKSW